MTHLIKKMNSGYTLLETVFYISLFAILSITVINAMITMTKAFKETIIQVELMQGGNAMERMSREIRQAYGINSISTNNLKLNTTDDVGTNKTAEFSFSGSDIRFLENDVFTGNLNTQNITVVNLAFTQIDTAKGVAVKIFLTVKSNHDSLNRNQDFYDTVALRGIY
ncbi:MAG: type II secretion system protein [Patescibacteria group bacterium]